MKRLPITLTRRQFLRRLGIASGGAVLSPAILDQLISASEKSLHVVIVGAGAAGLCAAYELQERGHTYVILEADRTHIGGRIRTLRFGDGLYGEAGAMRIPAAHKLTRHYIEEFGLPVRNFITSNPEGYLYLRGERARIKDGEKLGALYDLNEKERGKSPDELWSDLILRKLAALTTEEKEDLAAGIMTGAMKELDHRTLAQFAHDEGFSREGLEYLSAAYQLESVLTSAAVSEFLREEVEEIWTRDLDEIVGGTDKLTAAFVERLHAKPRLGCEVIAIHQEEGKAAAIYRHRGEQLREEGDVVLCTVPFPVLRRIDASPPFSPSKQRAMRQLQYESATKVLAVTKRRFWEADDGIYGGATFTDLPPQAVYYPSDNAVARDPSVSGRPSAFLASFTWGAAARFVDRLPPAERATFQINQLARIHPQLTEERMVKRAVAWSWDEHRWSGGAYVFLAPGQRPMLSDAARPEGRVFFAGEHCSANHSWIQGALESALIAVRDMVKVK